MATQAERIAKLEVGLDFLTDIICEIRDSVKDIRDQQQETKHTISHIERDVSKLNFQRWIGGSLAAIGGAIAASTGVSPQLLHDIFK